MSSINLRKYSFIHSANICLPTMCQTLKICEWTKHTKKNLGKKSFFNNLYQISLFVNLSWVNLNILTFFQFPICILQTPIAFKA